MFRVLIVVAISVLPPCFSGCELKQQSEQLRDTSRRVKQDLKNLQNRGAMDLEIQSMLTAVYTAYTDFTRQQNRGPASWQELEQAAAQGQAQRADILRAKSQRVTVVWDASLKQLEQPERATAKLAWVDNPVLGNVAILQADGNLTLISRNEVAAVPRAQ